jgi:hypothetical protein
MMKAYDRVEWCFLEKMLRKMGFTESWIAMVMRCVTSAHFLVKLNGGLSERFSPSRGLSQGDPIFPYLFLFCVEGFSALLRQAQREQQINGVSFGPRGPTINHLLFADDSVVFLEASEDSLLSLKNILQDYEVCSGQRINKQKSSILFGKGYNADMKRGLKETIGISFEALSEKYLGLPTAVGCSKEGSFKNLPERSWGKVHGWKGQGLSMDGKGTLIKSVLQAVPTYPMGCFHLSKKTCSKLTSIATGFWWGSADAKRKVPWISWDRMCVAKRNGGLGFRNFAVFNQALLAKQSWRMITNPSSLCSRVLSARYLKDGDILTASAPKFGSFTWKSILHGRDLLKEGLVWRIGNGQKIKVWEDNWIPRSGLMRPLGTKPDSVPVSRVSELLHADG